MVWGEPTLTPWSWRNLNALFLSEYLKLPVVEIGPRAVELLERYYPNLQSRVTIGHVSIEDAVRDFHGDEFGAIFTMNVPQHIHTDSE